MKNIFQGYLQLLSRKGSIAGKTADHLSVIDKFYADHIVQVENSSTPIKGKSTLKNMEIKNLKGVSAVSTTIQNYVIDEEQGLVWGEMFIDFQPIKGEKKRLEEAFFQKWENGQIVYQRFYYGAILGKPENVR